MEQDMNNEMEIDLIQLFKIILRGWKLISIITVGTFVLVFGYTFIVLHRTYIADSSMIVQVTEGEVNHPNLVTGQDLVDTYAEIIESNRVLSQLRSNLDIDLSNDTLREMINVSGVNDTLIIHLTVESNDEELAAEIADELVNIVENTSVIYDGLDNIEVLDSAKTSTSPNSPNRMLYLVIGILLGGMVSVGLVIGLEFFDKTIKTGEDVENILNLRLLSAIPEYTMDEEEV